MWKVIPSPLTTKEAGRWIMKTKKILTANLKPGMVACEAAYTSSNHLVIQSNTTLTQDIIDKLKYYAIRSLKVYANEDGEASMESPVQGQNNTIAETESTYFERVRLSAEFQDFKQNITKSVTNFKEQLSDIVTKGNVSGICDEMLTEVGFLLSKSRNALHLLDMLQCLRGFDDLTYMHSMNVALICSVIASWAGIPKEETRTLLLCGLLHDIGKLKIAPEIIQKPGKLTDEEFAQIRSHPMLGYEILQEKNLDERIKLAALQHHEKFNGKGYPQGLTGPEINHFSAIVTVADIYEAMTANRVYRKGMCPFRVLEILEQEKDLYDPTILYIFLRHTVEAYINTEVMLSNGETGRVVLLNQNFLSRPVVMAGKKTYDLSKNRSINIETLI